MLTTSPSEDGQLAVFMLGPQKQLVRKVCARPGVGDHKLDNPMASQTSHNPLLEGLHPLSRRPARSAWLERTAHVLNPALQLGRLQQRGRASERGG